MNTVRYQDKIDRAAQFLQEFITIEPKWCVILGSGLGGLGEYLDDPVVRIPYAEIPGFPRSGVQGHSGILIAGGSGGIGVLVMEGRFHRYEGHDWSTLILPLRVLIRLSVSRFILTNAAGGIRPDLLPGDLMMITDHINLMGGNPLTGPNLSAFGPRFPALTACYDHEIQAVMKEAADRHQVELKEGVYAALAGPNYETAAEIRMLKILGADAVGMSTVPEVIAIRHASARVIAVSMITNTTGGTDVPTHEEVMEMAERKKRSLHRVILDVIDRA
ncbi:purine-nucleoside phosphorylase [bacterium]|nr:purine-nucleoside phosphorylase [candidate division CSSED10-310 bacterium]